VYFILDPADGSVMGASKPNEDTVVGYVALQRDGPQLPGEADAGVVNKGVSVLLQHIYVEPECRRSGYATSALRVLLADTFSVAISRPQPELRRILSRLGFTDGSDFFVEELGSDDEFGNSLPCTFYRWTPFTE
jgi:GNAT superfamily N-acetyltransferase